MASARLSPFLFALLLATAASGVLATTPALGGPTLTTGTAIAKATGNCLPKTAAKIEEPADVETLTAAGQIIVRVSIKAGRHCFITPVGATGTVTLSGCYEVAGLGTAEVTIRRVGDGPACKAISNIQFLATPAPNGTVRICKTAGTGVSPGTLFTINANGISYNLAAGSCVVTGAYAVGTQVTLQEVIPVGYSVGSIDCTPSCTTTTPATGTAVISIAGGINTVTYLNHNAGTLAICKEAGFGIAPGQVFTILVNGTPYSVPAGMCVADGTYPIGTQVTIQEVIPVGLTVGSIACTPPTVCVSTNFATGSAAVSIAGGANTVTFRNQLPTNQLTVCKVAGLGVAIGTVFTYFAAGMSFNVPAGAGPSGTCTAAGLVPIGPVTVTEGAVAGIVVTDIDCAPVGCLISENLVARSATITMTATGATVTFTNMAVQ